MAAANWFHYLRLAYFSRPKSLREPYRLIKRHSVSRIVEIGISDARRSASLIEVAQRYAEESVVRYTGLDRFDSRPAGATSLSIKEAYRVLHATNACARLVPGEPADSLAAVANAHQNTDLILVSSVVADNEMQRAWFYLPRMLHQDTIVLRERGSLAEPKFDWLTHSDIAELAGRFGRRAA